MIRLPTHQRELVTLKEISLYWGGLNRRWQCLTYNQEPCRGINAVASPECNPFFPSSWRRSPSRDRAGKKPGSGASSSWKAMIFGGRDMLDHSESEQRVPVVEVVLQKKVELQLEHRGDNYSHLSRLRVYTRHLSLRQSSEKECSCNWTDKVELLTEVRKCCASITPCYQKSTLQTPKQFSCFKICPDDPIMTYLHHA